jgi:hypothetical protein
MKSLRFVWAIGESPTNVDSVHFFPSTPKLWDNLDGKNIVWLLMKPSSRHFDMLGTVAEAQCVVHLDEEEVPEYWDCDKGSRKKTKKKTNTIQDYCLSPPATRSMVQGPPKRRRTGRR